MHPEAPETASEAFDETELGDDDPTSATEPNTAVRACDDALDPLTALPSGSSTRKPRYGDVAELTLRDFDERGRSFGAWGPYELSLRRAVPGARVRAQVLRRRRSAIEARLVETLVPSPHAVTPRCAHAFSCGGCPLQALDYERQLAGLERLVREPFDELGLLDGVEIAPAELMPVELMPIRDARELYAYRNKMEFSFGTRRWIDPSEPAGLDATQTGFALGLHAAELYSKVVDVANCPIQSPAANAILSSAREIARAQGLTVWDVRTHQGFLRHLVLRSARATGEVLVNVVTSSDSPELIEPFAGALIAARPEITTLVQNVNTRPAQTAYGEREHVLHGSGRIVEHLGKLRFQISANSFFQTNTAQAEQLFEIVREECALTGTERVFDLYCGTGAIGLSLAHAAGEVLGFEQVPSAVADARRNAELNELANVRFLEGDVLASLTAHAHEAPPQVCVVDPPRAGLHPKVPAVLAALGAQRIVYVSCNPRAAARDVALLAALGYELVRLRPIDLFPHTPHVETVVTLRRREVRPT